MSLTPAEILEKRAAKLRKKLSGKKKKKKMEDRETASEEEAAAPTEEEKLTRENVNQPGPDGATPVALEGISSDTMCW